MGNITSKIKSISYAVERARGSGHPPVILSGPVKEDDGEYPVGLLVALDANDKHIPYAEVADEAIGTGDGSTKAYSGTLTNKPVHPGSLSITDDTETFSDDGYGRLTGDAGGTGTINYTTGAYSISFNANVTNAQDITGDYSLALDGVLDEEVDTAETPSGLYIAHGSVQTHVLKVGKTAKAAPTTAQLKKLRKMGIYPE